MNDTTIDPGGLYRAMQRIRAFELRAIELFRAGEFFGFLHSALGQEAVAVGACLALRRTDFITATHRSHGHLLAKGVSMAGLLAEIFHREEGLCGGVAGHVHVADLANGILGGNGVLGQNQPIATGLALGMKLERRDDVVITFFGEGTANEGAVHEAMNLAAVWSLPVLFLCERNGFAELTPYSTHHRVASIAERAQAFGMRGRSIDGTDVVAVSEAVGEAITRIRRGQGPELIEAKVVRWRGHYEGDPQTYREDRSPGADPIDLLVERFPDSLSDAVRKRIDDEVAREIDAAVAFARSGRYPDADRLFRVPGTREQGAAHATSGAASAPSAAEAKYRVAIRDALEEEMARDERVVLMGQDIGASGGLFRLTDGLFERFGAERVRDTPISETATVGAAIGLALAGFRPVVEVAFSDHLAVCFDAVINQLAKLRWMFGSQVGRLPVVIRAMTGAGIGAGAHHSQSVEAWFAHTPGLQVVMPATPRDAKSLLKAAIRSDWPVIFLEHKGLLREGGGVGGPEDVGEIGRAGICRPGTDVTMVGWSGTLRTCLAAAKDLAKESISAEVIDLRSVAPLDVPCIVASVRRTGRLLIVQEAHAPMSVGSEIVTRVVSEAFSSLRMPPLVVSPPFVPLPASRPLESKWLPSASSVVEAARGLHAKGSEHAKS